MRQLIEFKAFYGQNTFSETENQEKMLRPKYWAANGNFFDQNPHSMLGELFSEAKWNAK